MRITNPIELIVRPAKNETYGAYWSDGEVLAYDVTEVMPDLMPWLLARKLLMQGYDTERLLAVCL